MTFSWSMPDILRPNNAQKTFFIVSFLKNFLTLQSGNQLKKKIRWSTSDLFLFE